MKILIMQCSDDNSWYRNKVASRCVVQAMDKKDNYITKDGLVLKKDAAVIEK